jgi:hypothetical protein
MTGPNDKTALLQWSVFITKRPGLNRELPPGYGSLAWVPNSSTLIQSCNLLWPGNVDCVAGAGDFDFMAVGACCIPPFEIGIYGSVCCGYQHPTRFASPRSGGDDGFEIVAEVEYLRARHERGLLRGQVGCEVLMKLRGL